jgi:hypothetical protein
MIGKDKLAKDEGGGGGQAPISGGVAYLPI